MRMQEMASETDTDSTNVNHLSMKVLTEVGGLSSSDFENTIRTIKCVSKLSKKYPVLEDLDSKNVEPSLKRLLFPLKSLVKKLFCLNPLGSRYQKRKLKQIKLKACEDKTLRTIHHGSIRKAPRPSNTLTLNGANATRNYGIRRLRAENAMKLHAAYNDSPKYIGKSMDVTIERKGKCYVCKRTFSTSNDHHHFYDQLCFKCGSFNYKKRDQAADLSGKVALVTGGRIKIGFRVCLHLLRCGATVIVTTRFPRDALTRYSVEADFDKWKDALHIYGLDMRFIPDVERFCVHVSKTYDRLDILIQNACQTIRRPIKFYQHLIEMESKPSSHPQLRSWDTNCLPLTSNSDLESTSAICNVSVPKSVKASQLAVHSEDKLCQESSLLFPQAVYDDDHQQLDLRDTNSWILETDQVETSELVEVNLINSIAPFIILNKLTPLMKATTMDMDNYGWIILVSSMEGKFNRFKTSQHPHTNCAKASLNMLARTSAPYYRKFNLLLNAVDTGWVTDEDPIPTQQGRFPEFHPPLDDIDGAMRILDPIFVTINENRVESGLFFKDYRPSEW